tara:strand:+ start:7352 stop:7828 length:477 start_codon:yes stop_codon:yes gene_type:complete
MVNQDTDRDELDPFYFIELFSEVGSLLQHNYDSRSGLSRNQTRVIVTLLKTDGLTQTELADALGIHKVSAGIYISELEEIGLVERKPHPRDGRAKCIFLTPILHELRSGGEDIVRDMHRGVIEGIEPEEYLRLLGYMRLMRDNLKKMTPTPPPERTPD